MNSKEKLLLHCCCAPCSTSSIERIKLDFEPVLFFFNPNIEPIDEYNKRLSEMKRYAEITRVKLIIGEYENEDWNRFISGYEDEKEGGARCTRCFTYNLKKTAEVCHLNNIRYFTTTLTVSPYKNSENIFNIGKNINVEETEFYEINFKKKDGYKKSIELSEKYSLYRQKYCGCRFSREEQLNVR